MDSMLATRTELREVRGRTARPAVAHGRAPHQRALSERDLPLPATPRQRFKLEQLDLDQPALAGERAVSLDSADGMVDIVVPTAGSAAVVLEDRSIVLGTGMALLLAAGSCTTSIWTKDSSALLVRVPRSDIQALASRTSGTPRRLATVDHVFPWSLAGAAVSSGSSGARLDDARLETDLMTSLVVTLLSDARAEALFPVARSVQRAIDHIRAEPQHGWSIHDLAQIAGVTAGTLRRNFRECLGITVTQLVQQLRLEWVRSRLACGTESRSIADLSLAAGFGASGMLTRAYRRHFGETPTQTRARAFRAPYD